MAKFRVELHRCIESGLPPNPFRAINISLGSRSTFAVRSWEFEAKDEKEVRKLFAEAQEQNLPNVRGFSIRSIERLDGDKSP